MAWGKTAEAETEPSTKRYLVTTVKALLMDTVIKKAEALIADGWEVVSTINNDGTRAIILRLPNPDYAPEQAS